MALSRDQILTRVVDDFLDDSPVDIILHRLPELELNARGGRVRGDLVELPPQRVRLIPFKRRLTEEFRELPSDRIEKVEYIVTGSPDLDIQDNDWFEYEGEQYVVDFVSALRFHRVQAGATRRKWQAPDA